MFSPSDIGINPTICGGNEQQINRALQSLYQMMVQLSRGTGTVMRCQLQSPLSVGGSAGANIMVFDESGFVTQREGTVFDDDNIWQGDPGDFGICTLRDGQEDQYSVILLMNKGLQVLLEALGNLDLSSPTTLNTLLSSLNALLYALSHAIGGVDGSSGTTNLSTLLSEIGSKRYDPPLGIWILFGSLSGALSQGSSATMAVTGSAQTLTVWDAMLKSATSVASGALITVAWNVVHERYEVIAARCP